MYCIKLKLWVLGGFAWRSIGMNFESSHLENLFVALCEPHFSYIGWNLTQYWIFALFNSLFHRIQILLKISLIRFWFSTFSHHIWKDQGNDETDSHDNDNNDQTDWDDNDFHDFSISFYKLAKKAADIIIWFDLKRRDLLLTCVHLLFLHYCLPFCLFVCWISRRRRSSSRLAY